MAAQTRVSITKDNVSKVFKSISDLVGKQVLIGIPESANGRQNDEGEPINNAALGYIHEFGSPAKNIPARPFLIPGVEKAERPALAQLRRAADAALIGETKAADQALNAAGIIGMNSARTEIHTGDFVPLKPATIRARKYGRGTQSRRASETEYLALVKGGMPPADAQSATGIRPLIDTGQLANSLTYVVRKA